MSGAQSRCTGRYDVTNPAMYKEVEDVLVQLNGSNMRIEQYKKVCKHVSEQRRQLDSLGYHSTVDSKEHKSSKDNSTESSDNDTNGNSDNSTNGSTENNSTERSNDTSTESSKDTSTESSNDNSTESSKDTSTESSKDSLGSIYDFTAVKELDDARRELYAHCVRSVDNTTEEGKEAKSSLKRLVDERNTAVEKALGALNVMERKHKKLNDVIDTASQENTWQFSEEFRKRYDELLKRCVNAVNAGTSDTADVKELLDLFRGSNGNSNENSNNNDSGSNNSNNNDFLLDSVSLCLAVPVLEGIAPPGCIASPRRGTQTGDLEGGEVKGLMRFQLADKIQSLLGSDKVRESLGRRDLERVERLREQLVSFTVKKLCANACQRIDADQFTKDQQNLAQVRREVSESFLKYHLSAHALMTQPSFTGDIKEEDIKEMAINELDCNVSSALEGGLVRQKYRDAADALGNVLEKARGALEQVGTSVDECLISMETAALVFGDELQRTAEVLRREYKQHGFTLEKRKKQIESLHDSIKGLPELKEYYHEYHMKVEKRLKFGRRPNPQDMNNRNDSKKDLRDLMTKLPELLTDDSLGLSRYHGPYIDGDDLKDREHIRERKEEEGGANHNVLTAKIENGDKHEVLVMKEVLKANWKYTIGTAAGRHYSFDHPYVIKLRGVARETLESGEAVHYLVFPYYKNRDLRTWLRNRPMEEQKPPTTEDVERRVARLLKGAVLGLSYLHITQELLHGDIKPGNLLVNDEKETVLADLNFFKKAKPAEGRDSGLYTARNTSLLSISRVPGTKFYKTDEKPSQEADVFAMGVVILELLLLMSLPAKLQGKDLSLQGLLKQAKKSSDQLFRSDDLLKEVAEGRNIFKFLGLYKEGTRKNLDPKTTKLLRGMLNTDPTQRLSIQEVLDSPFFSTSVSCLYCNAKDGDVQVVECDNLHYCCSGCLGKWMRENPTNEIRCPFSGCKCTFPETALSIKDLLHYTLRCQRAESDDKVSMSTIRDEAQRLLEKQLKLACPGCSSPFQLSVTKVCDATMQCVCRCFFCAWCIQHFNDKAGCNLHSQTCSYGRTFSRKKAGRFVYRDDVKKSHAFLQEKRCLEFFLANFLLTPPWGSLLDYLVSIAVKCTDNVGLMKESLEHLKHDLRLIAGEEMLHRGELKSPIEVLKDLGTKSLHKESIEALKVLGTKSLHKKSWTYLRKQLLQGLSGGFGSSGQASGSSERKGEQGQGGSSGPDNGGGTGPSSGGVGQGTSPTNNVCPDGSSTNVASPSKTSTDDQSQSTADGNVGDQGQGGSSGPDNDGGTGPSSGPQDTLDLFAFS